MKNLSKWWRQRVEAVNDIGHDRMTTRLKPGLCPNREFYGSSSQSGRDDLPTEHLPLPARRGTTSESLHALPVVMLQDLVKTLGRRATVT